MAAMHPHLVFFLSIHYSRIRNNWSQFNRSSCFKSYQEKPLRSNLQVRDLLLAQQSVDMNTTCSSRQEHRAASAARSEGKATQAVSKIKSRVLCVSTWMISQPSRAPPRPSTARMIVLILSATMLASCHHLKAVEEAIYDLQLATNNVAPLLLIKLLCFITAKAAKTAPPESVRVVWVPSSSYICTADRSSHDRSYPGPFDLLNT